jgi:hypothetical protein
MNVDSRSRSQQGSGRLSHAFAGLQPSTRSLPIKPIGTRSLQLPPQAAEFLYTDRFSGLPQASEPISPLVLDSQEGGIDLTLDSETLSMHRSSTGLGQSNKYDLTAFHDFGMDNNSLQYDDGADALTGKGESQHGSARQEQQLDDDKVVKVNMPRQLTDAVQLVIRDQQKVSGMRIQLAEMRAGLNKNRNAQVSQWADAAKELQALLSNAPPLERANPASVTTQLHVLEAINQYSDDYLKQETQYQDFQRKLETEEHYLQRRETKLAELLRQFSWKSQVQELDTIFSNSQKGSGIHRGAPHTWTPADDNSDYASTSSSSHKGMHPLVENYLSKLGDVRIFRERLDDLSLEHAEVTERQASRNLVNMPLDKESEEFLSYYETERLELERILEEKIQAATLSRLQCEKEGVSLPADIPQGLATRLDMDIQQGLPREDRDILWLSEVDEHNPFFELANSGNFDAYHFINLWIFHQLRHSTSFIQRFKTNSRLQGLGINDDTLSHWVLRLWFQDDIPKIASPLRTASDVDGE